jgi:2-dehydro-3-deoxygluconokinase
MLASRGARFVARAQPLARRLAIGQQQFGAQFSSSARAAVKPVNEQASNFTWRATAAAAAAAAVGGFAAANTETAAFDTGTLKIKTAAECEYDGFSAGEVMMRLDPTPYPTHRARTCRVSYGGGEVNVTVGLSACFGLRCGAMTALVDDGIGRNIENMMREQGLRTDHFIWFQPGEKGKFGCDGKGTIHNGLNFTYAGKGLLPAITEYYRAHTAIREVGPGDVDWEDIFGRRGVRWFHTGGIYTLISDKAAESCTEALKSAGKHGTIRSFDLNYRSKVEPDKSRARRINREIMQHVDMVVGNHDDFSDALGYETAHTKPDCTFDEWLATYTDMLDKVATDYPNVQYIGTQVQSIVYPQYYSGQRRCPSPPSPAPSPPPLPCSLALSPPLPLALTPMPPPIHPPRCAAPSPPT